LDLYQKYSYLYLGFNVETVTPAPGITFTVWDIGGQSKIRPLYRHYYDKTDGLLFVVDSSDEDRLKEARDELFGIITNEGMSSVPVVIIANKSDLSAAIKPSELIEHLSLHSISRRRWYIQQACALNGDGIVEAMQRLAEMIRDNKKNHS
jgi:ADP-ribosylation factor protein 1